MPEPLLQHTKQQKIIRIAQFSDCHLFADLAQEHHGANVFNHLLKVLTHIANISALDCAIFTGDLTQDHSDQSYQRFVEAVNLSGIDVPIYFIAGNHDEHKQLNQHLTLAPFNGNKTLVFDYWQLLLVNSKSDTPAGFVDDKELTRIKMNNTALNAKEVGYLAIDIQTPHTMVFMHHHPLDVGYFIDRHGLQNQDEFWQAINSNKCIRLIACGHVHRGIDMFHQGVELFTCPATSVEFDKHPEVLNVTTTGPGYRLFELYPDGRHVSQCVYLP
jgi:Icc protein